MISPTTVQAIIDVDVIINRFIQLFPDGSFFEIKMLLEGSTVFNTIEFIKRHHRHINTSKIDAKQLALEEYRQNLGVLLMVITSLGTEDHHNKCKEAIEALSRGIDENEHDQKYEYVKCIVEIVNGF